MKKIILVLTAIFMSIFSSAQLRDTANWLRHLDSNSGLNNIYANAQSPEGGIWSVGVLQNRSVDDEIVLPLVWNSNDTITTFDQTTPGRQEAYIHYVNQDGDSEVLKAIPLPTLFTWINGIEATQNGGVAVFIDHLAGTVSGKFIDNGISLLNFDESGEFLWSRTIQGGYIDAYEDLLIADDEGNLVVGGIVMPQGASGASDVTIEGGVTIPMKVNPQFFFASFDSNGEVAVVVHDLLNDAGLRGVFKGNNGSVWASFDDWSATNTFGINDTSLAFSKSLQNVVVEFDSELNLLRPLNIFEDFGVRNIVATGNDELRILGSADGSELIETKTGKVFTLQTNNDQSFVVNLTAEDTVDWSFEFEFDSWRTMDVDPDGNMVFVAPNISSAVFGQGMAYLDYESSELEMYMPKSFQCWISTAYFNPDTNIIFQGRGVYYLSIGNDTTHLDTSGGSIAGLFFGEISKSMDRYLDDLDLEVCDSLVYWGESYKEDGQYFASRPNNFGGTDYRVINLTIKGYSSPETLLEVVACESYEDPYGQILTEDTEYWYHLNNVQGCDSTIHLVLTIEGPTYSYTDTTFCSYEPFLLSDGTPILEDGTYKDTIANQFGCDSVMTINATVRNTKGELELIDDTFTIVDKGDVTVYWFNCDTEQQVAQFTDTYSPSENGNYKALLVHWSGDCEIETECLPFIIDGVESDAMRTTEVRYSSSRRSLELDVLDESLSLELIGMDGRKYLESRIGVGTHSLNMKGLPDGVYILHLKEGGREKIQRVLIH